MNWQPHLKMIITDGIKTEEHNFMKIEADKKEYIEAFEKLISKFENKENLIVSLGY